MTLPRPPGPDRTGAEAKAEFMLRLRARGIRDLAVLRALEAVPRDIFVPHRYADLAAKEVALPIPCGQTMPEAFFVARMVEALGVTPSCHVLEIGAGSGYATAILARLAFEVLGLERYRSLAIQARTRLDALGVTNAAVVWGDGLAVPAAAGTFNRLVIHAAVEAVPARLLDRMTDDAIMVYARHAVPEQGGKQHLVRAHRDMGPAGPGPWQETILCASRLRGLERGLAQVL